MKADERERPPRLDLADDALGIESAVGLERDESALASPR